jgi:1-acyl-sn-glycerol-3-phosphate acyltransferase
MARLAFAAMGIRISTRDIERIPTGNAVLVFNHSSYLDSLVLAAVLPGAPAFVAKRELAGQIFVGPILRRLGVVFVERFDLAGGVADTETVTALARQGRIIVFFPEGTFTRRTGLAGFYLGAFKAASDTNLPVLPGIIRGTRTMLRGEQWFPRWGPIEVEIAEAIKPSGTDFASAVRLRDQVRAVMLARSKEPDLGDLAKPNRSGKAAANHEDYNTRNTGRDT